MASEPICPSENLGPQNMDDASQDLFAGVDFNGINGSTDEPEPPGLNPADGWSQSFFNEATTEWQDWGANPISSSSCLYPVVDDPGRPPVGDAPQPRANSRPALAAPFPPPPVRKPLSSKWKYVFSLILKLETSFTSRIQQIRDAVEAAIPDQSDTVLPSFDMTNPFDVSTDPRLGISALLAAQKGFGQSQPINPHYPTGRRRGGHVEPYELKRPKKTPPSPGGATTGNHGSNAAPFYPIQFTDASLPRTRTADHSRYLPGPYTQPAVDPSLHYHSLAGEFDSFGNIQSSAPIAPGYSDTPSNPFASSSTAATAKTSHPTTQAGTDDSSGRRRKASRGGQASAVDKSTPVARKSVSARSNGPTDVVEGMTPGAGADRLLPLQRATLPKGNVNGRAYCCEAKCGYDDSASLLINCDSSYHRKQPRLKLEGGEMSDRGWYHRGCGGLPLDDDPPRTWICPPCVQRGTLSTNDHDQDDDDDDDGGDDDQDDDEDSGDDYKPGKDTPNEDSDDDDDGGKRTREDSSKTGNVKGRDKARKKNGSKNRKRNKLDNDDEDDQNNKESGNLASSGRRKRYILDSSDDETGTSKPQNTARPGRGRGKSHIQDPQDETGMHRRSTQARTGRASRNEESRNPSSNTEADVPDCEAKTKAGALWNEEEKVMAIEFMRDIVREGTISGEARFVEIARRMRLRGHNRAWASVKNAWNRGLRERSGIDERKNKKAPLTTSKQDGETKRRNLLNKQNRGHSTSQTNVQPSRTTKSESPKRERQPEDGDDDIPPKRRRSSP